MLCDQASDEIICPIITSHSPHDNIIYLSIPRVKINPAHCSQQSSGCATLAQQAAQDDHDESRLHRQYQLGLRGYPGPGVLSTQQLV